MFLTHRTKMINLLGVRKEDAIKGNRFALGGLGLL